MEKTLGNNNIVEAVLADLLEMFDGIPHNVHVAKRDACRFSMDAIAFIYSYLK